MRTMALLALMVTGTAACTMVGRSAGRSVQGKGARSFYLTKETVQGNRALDACARGYHMASRFEIADVTVLTYDSTIGLTTDDSGSGPPSEAAPYGSPGPSGWVRTGGASRFTDSARAAGAAFTNCAAWSTNSPEAYGTVAYLTDRFTLESGSTAPLWNGGSERCDGAYHVWCIGDPADTGITPPPEGRHRHRRGGGSESEPPP